MAGSVDRGQDLAGLRKEKGPEGLERAGLTNSAAPNPRPHTVTAVGAALTSRVLSTDSVEADCWLL